MSKPQVILGKGLLETLMGAGILPDNCRRAVIDVTVDKPVKVYYECYGDERLLDVDFAEHIGAMITEKKAEGEHNEQT